MTHSPQTGAARLKFTGAGHIRGTVERAAGTRDHWWYTVTNTRTGTRIIHSDEFSHAEAMTSCAIAVSLARGAWFFDLDRTDLAQRTPKTLKLHAAEVQAVLTWALGSQPYGADRLMSRLVAVVGA